VIGFGSYASGAMVLAGLSLGLWTAIHEGNAVPGVANRLLGRLVQRVYLGTDIGSRKWYVGGRARVFGTPIRAPIAELPHTPRQAKNGRPLRILVLGGFWGSEFLARETPSLLGGVQRLGVPLDIWHQTGRDHIELAEREYGKIGLTTRLSTFIDDMAIAYRWADFVIARSGASVMSELAAVGTPALLVPWADAAHDHQTPNAKAFAESGAGIWTSEHDFRSEKTAATVLIAADLLRSRSAVE
jgi:UDP-N-acetylglucosamine--N-acetylmuramyl-(pentapeptide) pyrophosphoryl-undecaprenol N-acetylglucosamine transferase